MILTFNFTMSYAKASSFAEQFVEESFPAAYAGVVTTMMTVGAGAVNVNDFMKESGQEIYDTAKATWPQLSSDMQANFKDSLSKMADGVVTAGDWITAGLDALKGKFGGTETTYPPSTVSPGSNYNAHSLPDGLIFVVGASQRQVYRNIHVYFIMKDTPCGKNVINVYLTTLGDRFVSGDWYPAGGGCSNDAAKYAQGLAIYERAKSAKSVNDLKALIEALGLSVALTYNGNPVLPTDNAYNRMDKWLRDVAIPAGNLGVYTPNEAWTNKGYRLGLSADGQQLLTLPDGLPYDPSIHGEYSWRKPLTQVIDGLPAVLDPTTWNWVNARDKTIVKPATIPEIAEYVGTDVDTAEKIKNETKGEGSTGTGSLKNPTKAIVWTPLMMAGTAMTTKFPFSLPWDLINQLKIFDVAPQAPKFDINIPDYLQISGQTIPLAFTLDLSLFDKVAVVVRWFNVIIWDIALILVLRRLLPE